MKVYIDTEFYEFQPHDERGTLGLPQDYYAGANAIQLISLGAVREDGAEFYAENSEFDWRVVPEDHWIQENVRPLLWNNARKGNEKFDFKFAASVRDKFEGINFTGGYWEPAQIAQAFYEFSCTYALHPSGVATPENVRPEFWGYYCDYDWVVLCGLYGRMDDLPEEFPMYCLDLKQEIRLRGVPRMELPGQKDDHHALADAHWVKAAHEYFTIMSESPKNTSAPDPESEPRATFDIPEVAEMLGCSRSAVYRWAQAGEIPTIKIGRRVLVTRKTIDDLLAGEGFRA